jgi:putative transposase
MVWPCPLPVDAYVAAGREVGFPRPACPLCAGALVFWSGYWRNVREAGRCRKIFVPRLRCAACQVSHALLPAFVLAWRLDVAEILFHRHGIAVSERTVRGQLRRAGLHREALAAEPKTYGRYEAARPNERWITDVLVGPWVPWPRTEGSARAQLFLIVDDHSRLLVDGRFFAHENARACQDLLRRAITRRGVPDVLYADNGAPFSNAWLARTCAVLGVRLVHSQPYSPQGRGKQERLNRYIREAFLAEATHQGIDSLEQLNDLFFAWAEQVANRRAHAETGQAPICRFEADGPPRQADPGLLREAFRWSVTRKVTRTATVPLEGNAYAVDPALTGRRVELRYDPL